MKLSGESPLESEISDFADVICCGENGEDPPVIVGGHAAGLWSRYYMAMGVHELSEYLPFRSKDLDLVGNMELLERLQRRVKGTLLRSEPRSPVFGRLDIPQPEGGFLRCRAAHRQVVLAPVGHCVLGLCLGGGALPRISTDDCLI